MKLPHTFVVKPETVRKTQEGISAGIWTLVGAVILFLFSLYIQEGELFFRTLLILRVSPVTLLKLITVYRIFCGAIFVLAIVILSANRRHRDNIERSKGTVKKDLFTDTPIGHYATSQKPSMLTPT